MESLLIKMYWPMRLLFFILFFSAFAVWETLRAWRYWLIVRWVRWWRHGLLAMINVFLLRIFSPGLALVCMLILQRPEGGIIQQIPLPYFVQVALGVVCMDGIVYFQHRLLHRYAWLWRVHAVHHLDKQLDISTGVRFHPLEAIFTAVVKGLGGAVLGLSVFGFLLFEILYDAWLLFAHLNVRLPLPVERKLRWFFITPGMHRIHHSDTPSETNSNFGFIFSWWDRCFASYCSQPRTGEKRMVMGLEDYSAPRYQKLSTLLWFPFRVKQWDKKRKKNPLLGRALQGAPSLLEPFKTPD